MQSFLRAFSTILTIGVVAIVCEPSIFGAASDGLPEEARALAFAEHLQAEVPPYELAASFRSDPIVMAKALCDLATALMAANAPVKETAPDLVWYLASVGGHLGQILAAEGPPWREDDLDLWLTVLLVHPQRFVENAEFRERVASVLPLAIDPSIPATLKDALLEQLNRMRGMDFELSEQVELAWGRAPRSSVDRQVVLEDSLARTFVIQSEGRIEATVMSLPSWIFEIDAVERFLVALETHAGSERTLIIMADTPMITALEKLPPGPRTYLLTTHGQNFSPWPRDPFFLARRADGGVLILSRPNPQPGREADNLMGRELIHKLPPLLDWRWGETRWAITAEPFHHGQMLATDAVLWISIHTLEEAILERLGLEQIPEASFATAEGVDRYLVAASEVADALGRMFQRPVRFVHPLPLAGDANDRQQAMIRLGGGVGFDLDSLLTLVPASQGAVATALVADLDGGRELLSKLSEADLGELLATYEVQVSREVAVERLIANMGGHRARKLDEFLEVTAEHLASNGWRIDRLPLLLVPMSLLADRYSAYDHHDFLIGWNNVVLEPLSTGMSAEGFAAGFASGDALAEQIYAEAGVRLFLLPPLVESIVGTGGYRCASNQLRRR